jgi:hypothetical protein
MADLLQHHKLLMFKLRIQEDGKGGRELKLHGARVKWKEENINEW